MAQGRQDESSICVCGSGRGETHVKIRVGGSRYPWGLAVDEVLVENDPSISIGSHRLWEKVRPRYGIFRGLQGCSQHMNLDHA